jgi:hypothetical protein
MHEEFNKRLLQQAATGKRLIVVTDEAQNLEPEAIGCSMRKPRRPRRSSRRHPTEHQVTSASALFLSCALRKKVVDADAVSEVMSDLEIEKLTSDAPSEAMPPDPSSMTHDRNLTSGSLGDHEEILLPAQAAAYMQQIALKLRDWRELQQRTPREVPPELDHRPTLTSRKAAKEIPCSLGSLPRFSAVGSIEDCFAEVLAGAARIVVLSGNGDLTHAQ